MTKLWINIFDDTKADHWNKQFRDELRYDLTKGQFWADRIKDLKDDPRQRLHLAIQYLPLPASFREGAKALRAIIREKRKSKEKYDLELKKLYHLAVVRSFMIMHAEKANCPGPNVMEFAPGGLIFNLDYSYYDIGYNELDLLNKTDIKLLVQEWGEPRNHSTLHKKYQHIWNYYEEKLADKRKRDKFKNIDPILKSLKK